MDKRKRSNPPESSLRAVLHFLERCLIAVLALSTCFPSLNAGPVARADEMIGIHRVEREGYLMGTKVSLEIYSTQRRRGLRQLEDFLRIMEATEAELSTWKLDSTISRFNQTAVGVNFPLERETCRLAKKLVDLHGFSNGAFDPAVGNLVSAWGIHGSVRIPDPRELEIARLESGFQHFSFSLQECVASKGEEILLDSGAFGKGEALDRVRVYSERFGADPWLINLGGQVAVFGHPPHESGWTIDIASPLERETPLLTLSLRKGSLATSGNSARSDSVAGVVVGHIIDPRTGRPSTYPGSVTVWHPEALFADALATALHVMGPEEGIGWANVHGIAVCYLNVAESGEVEMLQNELFDRLVCF